MRSTRSANQPSGNWNNMSPANTTVTISASTTRPVTLSLADLDSELAAVDCWFDDPHGAPDWRAHVSGLLAREVAAELVA